MFLVQMSLYLCSHLDLIVKSEIINKDANESSDTTEVRESIRCVMKHTNQKRTRYLSPCLTLTLCSDNTTKSMHLIRP